jgi:hypothetical protein
VESDWQRVESDLHNLVTPILRVVSCELRVFYCRAPNRVKSVCIVNKVLAYVGMTLAGPVFDDCFINSLKIRYYFVSPGLILTIIIFWPHSVDVFRLCVSANSDYFSIQH